MKDIQSLFQETTHEFMENGLEAELEENLGYSKYDYKDTELQLAFFNNLSERSLRGVKSKMKVAGQFHNE